MDRETRPGFESYLALAEAFRRPDADAPRDITLAYTRLFIGPGKPVAPPYESVYVEGRLMGESTVRVTQWYQDAGLQVDTADGELPDHISFEFAFMAHLARQESLHPDQAASLRKQRSDFLLQHLGRWLPEFCERILRSQTHPFYSEAAREASQLFMEELSLLESSTSGTSGTTAGETQTATNYLAEPLTLIRKSPRYANINVQVDLSRCTLCVLCTDSCPTEALTVLSTSSTLSLLFDASHCNGCRICLRRCPEGAVTLSRGSPLAEPQPSQKSVVASARRVVCPGCDRPHIAVPWLERLVERLGGEASDHLSLVYCPLCKAHSVSTRPLQGELSQGVLRNA